MNIYQEAYNLGIALRNSDVGKNILDMYNKVRSCTSENSFNDLHNLGQRLMHYYLFSISLERLKINKDNKKIPDFMRNEFYKIINTPEIELFCKECELFGKKLEEASKNFFSKEISKEFAGDIKSPEIVRSMLNLNAACIRSGLVQRFMYYNSKVPNFKDIFRDYERERSIIKGTPFGKNVRKLIKKLKSNYDSSILYYCEFFISVLIIIKEIVFESHLGLISEINREDLISFRILGDNQIKFFKIELPSEEIKIFKQNGIITLLSDSKEKIFLLVKKRIVSFNRETGSKIMWSGLVCPTKVK